MPTQVPTHATNEPTIAPARATTYGYARVSTRDQNLARQIDALREFGVEEDDIFADKASGKDFCRPAYQRLMGCLGVNDVMVITSIDRLGRNYDEILTEWRRITKEKAAHVVVLDMPLLDTRTTPDNITGTFIADLVLQILSYVAQVERESIHRRQAEGIAAARARGVHCGPPRIKRPANYQRTRTLYLAGDLTRKEAARRMGVAVGTLGKWVREDRNLGGLNGSVSCQTSHRL